MLPAVKTDAPMPPPEAKKPAKPEFDAADRASAEDLLNKETGHYFALLEEADRADKAFEDSLTPEQKQFRARREAASSAVAEETKRLRKALAVIDTLRLGDLKVEVRGSGMVVRSKWAAQSLSWTSAKKAPMPAYIALKGAIGKKRTLEIRKA